MRRFRRGETTVGEGTCRLLVALLGLALLGGIARAVEVLPPAQDGTVQVRAEAYSARIDAQGTMTGLRVRSASFFTCRLDAPQGVTLPVRVVTVEGATVKVAAGEAEAVWRFEEGKFGVSVKGLFPAFIPADSLRTILPKDGAKPFIAGQTLPDIYGAVLADDTVVTWDIPFHVSWRSLLPSMFCRGKKPGDPLAVTFSIGNKATGEQLAGLPPAPPAPVLPEGTLLYVPGDGPFAWQPDGMAGLRNGGAGLTTAPGHKDAAIIFEEGRVLSLDADKRWRPAAGTVEAWLCLPALPADQPAGATLLSVISHWREAMRLDFTQSVTPVKNEKGELTGEKKVAQSFGGIALPALWKAGEWHHVAFTWNSWTDSLYVDGKPAGIARPGRRFWDTTRPDLENVLNIGGTKLPGGMLVDEFTLYDWAMAGADVMAARDRTTPALAFPETRRLTLWDAAWAPGENAVLAGVDLEHFPKRDAARTVKVEMLDAAGKAIAAETMRWLPERLELKVVRAAALPAGDYRLKATVLDGAGKTLGTVTTPAHTVKAYPWLHNKLGETDRLPAEWTPVKAEETRDGVHFDVWGRAHLLAPTGLPAAITSDATPLLAAPVKLTWKSGEVGGELAGGVTKLGAHSDTRAEWTTRNAQLGRAAVSGSGWIEYDGVSYQTLTIDPGKQPLTLDGLTLEIRVRKEQAKLIHAVTWNSFWWHTTRRLLSPTPGNVYRSSEFRNGSERDFFNPYVWLGNDDRGLTWFAENPRNWHSADRYLTTVERLPDGSALLRIPFINTPTTLTEPTTYEFGFLATPVKPLPPRWRAMLAGTPYTLEKRVADYAGREKYKWIWPNPGFPQQDFNRSFAVGPEDPTGDKWAAYWGEKFATQPPKPNTWGGPGYPVPYTDLHIVQSDAWPDYADFIDECGGYDYWTMGASQGMQDYFLWRFTKPWVERQMVGGIYIDEPYGQGAGWTYSPFIGGYFDETGRLQPSWTLLRERQFLKRILMVQRQYGLWGMIWLHMTANWYPPAHTHVTAIMDGEIGSGLTSKDDDVIGYWISGWLRACDRGQPTGLIPLNMNSNIRGDFAELWRPWLGMCWTHDVLPVAGIDPKYAAKSYAARMDFDIAAPDVQFLGYWDNRVATVKLATGQAAPEPAPDLVEAIYGPADDKGKRNHPELAVNNPYRVFVSLYRRPDKALITVLNYNDTEAAGELVLDEKWWAFVKDWQVTDAESGQTITATRIAIPFTVSRRDFRMFWVGPRK